MLIGFNYNGAEYFYIRSLTGNIEKVIDSNGNIRVEYVYDAWGSVLSITGDAKIKGVNKFLFKGYYYDFETSLYYCNSRYYNPEWGRWLNADDVSYLNPQSINGLNLYAYCGNNPVMYCDPNGNSFISWWNNLSPGWKIAFGLGIIVGFGLLTVATAGAGTGAALASVFSATMAPSALSAICAGAFVGSALIGTGGFIIGGIGNGDGWSWENAANGLGIGVVAGAVIGGAWGGIHYALQYIGQMPVKMDINDLFNNTIDEFVTNGPYDKAISHWTKNLAQNPYGYNTIPNLEGVIEPIKVVRGTTQIANGHHRIMVLKKLGVKTIEIFYTL